MINICIYVKIYTYSEQQIRLVNSDNVEDVGLVQLILGRRRRNEKIGHEWGERIVWNLELKKCGCLDRIKAPLILWLYIQEYNVYSKNNYYFWYYHFSRVNKGKQEYFGGFFIQSVLK